MYSDHLIIRNEGVDELHRQLGVIISSFVFQISVCLVIYSSNKEKGFPSGSDSKESARNTGDFKKEVLK